MTALEHEWPDKDRRNAALDQVAKRVHQSTDPQLRPSEIRVIQLASVGLDDHEIADLLDVSAWTVKDQMKRARRLLAAKTRAHLVAVALREGVIQ